MAAVYMEKLDLFVGRFVGCSCSRVGSLTFLLSFHQKWPEWIGDMQGKIQSQEKGETSSVKCLLTSFDFVHQVFYRVIINLYQHSYYATIQPVQISRDW